MTEAASIPKSLTEQILDEMFTALQEVKEFDSGTIQELRKLALTGELKKAPQVTKAVKSALGEKL